MKTYTKPLIGGLMSAAVATLAGCGFFTEKLTAKPELLEQVNKSATRPRMHTLDITSVELACSADKKVVGEFTFLHLDGRKPMKVAGDTSCEKPGKLATWAVNELATRANYTPELLTGEVDKLLTTSKLAPQPGHNYMPDVATALEARYKPVLPKDWHYVAFSCDVAGGNYEYTTYSEDEKVRSGSLKAMCTKPNQNFAVSVIPSATLAGKSMLMVRQFNHADPRALTAAFAELLDAKLPVAKF